MAEPARAVLYPLQARLPAPIYWLYRGLRTAMTALCFAAFWTGAVIASWLWFPVIGLWPGSRRDRMRRFHRSVRRGFGVFHFTMRTMRLYHRVSPVPRLRPGDSPVVLVANHPTLCDVTSIVSLFPDVVAVARPSFSNNPLLARVVRSCGFVPTGARMIRDCEERLRLGFDVLVFPEGTRSPRGGSLHPFHRGAFELAARAKVPIVLLKLTCMPPALSKGLPIWKVSDRMAVLTVEPFDVIYPSEHRPPEHRPPEHGPPEHGPSEHRPSHTGIESRAMCRTIEQRYRDLFGYPAATAAASAPQPVGDLQ